MTLYYSLVFLMLVTEMALFMLLILPLPFTWRRKIFTFVSESPIVAKLQYGMKIFFIAVLILFIDSVNRVYRVQIEHSANADGGQGRVVVGGGERMEMQARKFYAQRNMYLCGFTLFLSLILNRTYMMILDVLRLEERVKSYEGDPKAKGKDAAALGNAGGLGEVASLRKELEQKERDLQTLRKQSEGLHREYNNLSDQFGAANKQDAVPRKEL